MTVRRPLYNNAGTPTEIPDTDAFPAALIGDPWLGYAATYLDWSGVAITFQSGVTSYTRVTRGVPVTASKIGVQIVTASGNICVAVYRNTGSGRTAAPGVRAATSGSIACPAAGYNEVALGSSVSVGPGDWLAISADNATATAIGITVAAGFAIRQPLQCFSVDFPCPSPAGTFTTTQSRSFQLLAIP